MSVRTRPMTNEERKILKQYTKASRYRDLIAPHVFGSFMVFAVLFVVLSYGGDFVLPLLGLPGPSEYKAKAVIGCAAVTLLVMGTLLLREIKALRATGSDHDPAAEDLGTDITNIETFGVQACVELEEFDDEGAGFFLELTDGRVLCVIGQQLYPYSLTSDPDPESPAEKQTPPFPSDRIEFSCAPKSRVFFDVVGVGTYLKPRSKVSYGPKGPANSDLVDNTFYQGRLEEVLARFGFVEVPLHPV
jgi:hypothetical protein